MVICLDREAPEKSRICSLRRLRMVMYIYIDSMIWNEIHTRGAQKHNFELVGWYIGEVPAGRFLFVLLCVNCPLRMGVKADKM